MVCSDKCEIVFYVEDATFCDSPSWTYMMGRTFSCHDAELQVK